jgi:hypothetical protein
MVTLDGSASVDPEGAALTFSWTLLSKPADSIAVLSGANTARPSFRADLDGEYTLRLTVSDGVLSASAQITVMAATSAEDLARSAGARLEGLLEVGTGQLTLSWFDRFDNAQYRIERVTAAGAFETLDTIRGLSDQLTRVEWSRQHSGAETYRVIAIASGREIPIKTEFAKSRLEIRAPVPQMVINANKVEPITGAVNLSTNPIFAGSSTRWYDGPTQIGITAPFNWNTGLYVDGAHAIRAVVDQRDGQLNSLTRTITTSNPAFIAQVRNEKVGFALNVYVATSNGGGTAKVDVSVNGQQQTLLGPNFCCEAGQPAYKFTYDSRTIGNGSHTISATATAQNGSIINLAQPVTIFNPVELAIALTSPADGDFVTGTLAIAGTYTADSQGTVRASLGPDLFLETTNPSFSANYSLAGKDPGNYTLNVNVRTPDNKVAAVWRQVIVVSSPAKVLTPIYRMPDSDPAPGAWGMINEAIGDLVTYRRDDDTHWVFNAATGTNARLDQLRNYARFGDIDANYVYERMSSFPDPNCTWTSQCIIRWSLTTGSFSNLSALDPAYPPTDVVMRSDPIVRGKYVAWSTKSGAGDSSITVYDTVANSFVNIPDGAQTAITAFDIVETPSGAIAIYWSKPASGDAKLKRWQSGVTSDLTTAPSGVTTDYAGADATTVVYSYVNASSERTVATMPIGGGASTVLTSTAWNLILPVFRDGVAGWTEPNNAPGSNMPYRLWSVAQGTKLFGFIPDEHSIRGGKAIHLATSGNTGMYLYDGATGVSSQLTEFYFQTLFIGGAWAYFVSGEGIYRISMN